MAAPALKIAVGDAANSEVMRAWSGVPPMRFQSRKRALLIHTHQPAIAGDIGGEDGGKAALGAFFDHGRDRVQRTQREIVLSLRQGVYGPDFRKGSFASVW